MVRNRRFKIAVILFLGLIGGLLNQLLIVTRDYNTMAARFVVKNSNGTNVAGVHRNESKPVAPIKTKATPTDDDEDEDDENININNTTTSENNDDVIVHKNNGTSVVNATTSNLHFEEDHSINDGEYEPDDYDSPMFRWDYLDPNQKATCGGDKCLFRSSSRVSTTHLEREGWACIGRERPTGYLVSKNSKHNESIFDGWKISEYLTSEFGIKHFLLEPPIQKKLYKSTAEALFLRDNPNENEDFLTEAYGQLFGSADDDSVTTTVQKVRIALDSGELRLKHTEDEIVSRLEELLRGTTTTKIAERTPYNGNIKSNVKGNIKSNSNSTHETVTRCGTPLSIFFEKLEAGVTQTLELLRCEPLLALDFQVIVDVGGNLYHLDFDRVLTQLGGLLKYNRTHFDSKVRSRLEGATRVLSTVRRWIQTKQQHQPGMHSSTNITTITTPNAISMNIHTISSTKCLGNWEDEESAILVSRTLPCLATERVAMARHTTTSTMAGVVAAAAAITANATPQREHEDDHRRLKHPLLVALLQRVIEGGFYGGVYDASAEGARNCNVYGDRVTYPPNE